ncbi:MAG: sugar MFS transporter [Thermoflavifilum sp.]|nr:sugar MFS transporter [Thermoflavifilum sp.]
MQQRSRLLVGVIMLTFFVISFFTNIIGPLIPDIIRSFHLSLTLVAILPFSFFIAYGVMSIPSGMLVERYSEKSVMLAAFTVAFVGSWLLALWPGYLTAILSVFLIGCGMAMLQVVINPLLRTAGGAEHYAFFSVMAQLIFGLASFVSPLVYAWIVLHFHDPHPDLIISLLHRLVQSSISWISLYWIFGLISIVMWILLYIIPFPRVERTAEEAHEPLSIYAQLLRKRVVWLFFLGIFCYVGTEQGLSGWMSQFLWVYHGADPHRIGATAVSRFWGLMTVGGLVGLPLMKLWDSRQVLIVFTFLAICCLSLGLYGNANLAIWCFPLTGFFASIMYPVIISLALNSLDAHHGAFAGILMTAIIGGAIIPLTMGFIGDHAGLRTSYWLVYITLFYILGIGFWAKPIISNQTIQWRKDSP